MSSDPLRFDASDRARRRRTIFEKHPIITSVMLACTLAGAAAGYALLGEHWPPVRRLLGGAIGGAGCGLLITAARMIG
ncbi:MAG TPA: hypothetical protein VIY27_05535 [Myxococcota bacterium]